MKRRLYTVVLVGGLVMTACGADDIAEKAIDGASGGDVDVEIDDDGGFGASDGDGNSIDVGAKDGNLVIEGADGNIYTSGAELPDSFPEDTIRFPLGFAVHQAQEQRDGDFHAWVVIGRVSEPVSPVAEELKAKYGEPDNEYEQGSGGTDDHSVLLEWSEYEGYAMTWNLNRNADGDTVVSMSAKETQS